MNIKHPVAILLLAITAYLFPALAAANNDYMIGPKDVVTIKVFDEDELNRTETVDAEGNIRFPLLKQVEVGGLTVRQAEKKIEELLGKRFLVNPHVSIEIKEYNANKVYVLGAVKKPGYYSLTGQTTLLEILSNAGGISDNGGQSIILVRGATQNQDTLQKILNAEKNRKDEIEDFTEEGVLAPIAIDGHKLLNEGDIRLNYTLKGGDVVYVPVVRQVFVIGEVKRPGGIKYTEGITLLKAISLTGGLTTMAKKKVLIKRVVKGEEKKIKVNLNSVIKDTEKDVPLIADDVIVVPRRLF